MKRRQDDFKVNRERSRSPGRERESKYKERDCEKQPPPELDEFGRLVQKNKQPRDPTENMTEEEKMQFLLGFSQFDSTQGKPVLDNVKSHSRGAVAKSDKRKYKQFRKKQLPKKNKG